MLGTCAALSGELFQDLWNCLITSQIVELFRKCLAPNVSLTLVPKKLGHSVGKRAHFHHLVSKNKLFKQHHIPGLYKYGHLDPSTR
jgi:hypothetical protein